MSRFIESIRFESGAYHLLEYHQDRVNRVFREYFQKSRPIQLSEILDYGLNPSEKFKCRLIFDFSKFYIEYLSYSQKKVESLRAIVNDEIDYSFKYEDRKVLRELYSQRGDCDDILIVKKGRITDSSYANVLFEKEDHWYTSDTPLLKGVQREYLIDTGIVKEVKIDIHDLNKYDTFMICNSMLPFDVNRRVEIGAIVK